MSGGVDALFDGCTYQKEMEDWVYITKRILSDGNEVMLLPARTRGGVHFP